MAIQETNYWKIGLLVVSGVAVAIATIFYLGAQRLARERIERVTYFDESVQGLDIGAPLKMRGVTIGTVKDITIAPDHRLVEVTSDVFIDVMVRLDLGTEEELRDYTAPIPEDLRVQLATTGITGVKFLLVDFFKDAPPSPELSFEPGPGYVPSTPSTLKSIEDSFYTLAQRLPEALESITTLANTLERQAGSVDIAALQASILDLVANADQLVGRVDGQVEKLDVGSLQIDVRAALKSIGDAALQTAELFDRLEAQDGPLGTIAADVTRLREQAVSLLASVETSVEGADLPGTASTIRASTKGLSSEGAALAAELNESLLMLQETLAAVQALATTLEREPGALLQGRASDPPRPEPKR